jgi:N-acyl-D-aspartate/D-glutamate deacylase
VTHDLVIRDGLVADGRGGEPVPGDVAIDGDRVAAVGVGLGRGRRELDADGRLVTPGFVDIHTHLDAQLGWDALATSSCWHGVTSVVLGSCGVTFAPCRPEDRRYLAELMESVEDVPADSIMAGLDWDWETYGEYLDAVGRWPKGVNVGGMVGHCAVRYHAMGERGLDPAPATDDDLEAMCELVDEAIGAGALGFSTSRTMLHRVPDGRAVPGTYADARELHALAAVLGRRGAGVFEAAPALGERDPGGGRRTVAEVELLADLALATGRPVTFGLSQTKRVPELHDEALEAVEAARARGATLAPQTTARGIGMLFGLVHRTPFDGAPAWRALKDLPLDERLAALRDPGRRAALVDAARDLPTIPPEELFVLPAGDARYDLGPEDSLAGHAARLGVTPAEAFITLELGGEGRPLVNWPFLNDDLDAVAVMLRHPDTVMGLADAGAHVGLIMDASQPTFLLTYWVRERGLLSVGEAVRRLTSEPAQLFGLTDRGVLEPGAFADVNVLDLDDLGLPQPQYVHDYPAGAGRYVQRSRGYAWTLVNGRVFLTEGEPEGPLSGCLLRNAAA